MAYDKQTWDTTSYVNPTRMNHIEQGIYDAKFKVTFLTSRTNIGTNDGLSIDVSNYDAIRLVLFHYGAPFASMDYLITNNILRVYGVVDSMSNYVFGNVNVSNQKITSISISSAWDSSNNRFKIEAYGLNY